MNQTPSHRRDPRAEIELSLATQLAGNRRLAELRVEADTNTAAWPDAWKLYERKSFPRFASQIRPLPPPDPETQRRSVRSFQSLDITGHQLGLILAPCFLRETPTRSVPTREAPSAGGLFPIEIYAIPTSGPMSGRVYYYDAEHHALVPTVSVPSNLLEDPCDFLGMSRCKSPSVLLVFTSVMYRTMRKYAARGYRYALIEAGAMAQSIETHLNAAGGFSAVWLGGFDDVIVAETLGLRPELDLEYPLLAMAIGRPS